MEGAPVGPFQASVGSSSFFGRAERVSEISIFGLVCLYHKQNCYVAHAQSESIDMKLAVTMKYN